MRVVTGEAKGRKLKGPKTAGTRPIIDRVKQALFNILSTRVEDARFLDLFAGTGSVGIEALSRGAASATFIELNHKVLALVRENLQITGLSDRAVTLHADAFKFLQAAQQPAQQPVGADLSRPPPIYRPKSSTLHTYSNALAPYDIIYVAPPQYQEMAARALRMLDGSPLVARTGLVIVQIHPKERAGIAAVSPTRLLLTDERRYGSTLLMFYETKEEQSLDDK
ncbi:MAG: 16S rRNA (guanine(966)-N(2))-methyltransferase RsmD [Ktedonobacteraceae bacterium]